MKLEVLSRGVGQYMLQRAEKSWLPRSCLVQKYSTLVLRWRVRFQEVTWLAPPTQTTQTCRIVLCRVVESRHNSQSTRGGGRPETLPPPLAFRVLSCVMLSSEFYHTTSSRFSSRFRDVTGDWWASDVARATDVNTQPRWGHTPQ